VSLYSIFSQALLLDLLSLCLEGGFIDPHLSAAALPPHSYLNHLRWVVGEKGVSHCLLGPRLLAPSQRR
jgi:hypothetical protein